MGYVLWQRASRVECAHKMLYASGPVIIHCWTIGISGKWPTQAFAVIIGSKPIRSVAFIVG